MKNTIGSPVSAANFYNRTKELRRIMSLLEEDNSILLLGLRRTGKSSLLRETAQRLKVQGKQVIYVDASTCHSIMQFYQLLYAEMPFPLQERFKNWILQTKAIPSRLTGWLTEFLEKTKVPNSVEDLIKNWSEYELVLEKLIGDFLKKENNIVLFIDELPFLFEKMGNNGQSSAEIQSFLTVLRTWRESGLPMGIAGSLNIHLQIDHLKISRKLLAGLNTVAVKPFNRDEAEGLINSLLQGRELEWWTPAITKKILDLLPDFLPYFIQKSFSDICAEGPKTVEEVEEVYNNSLEPFLIRDFLYQFEERLAGFDGEDRMIFSYILDVVAKKKNISLGELQGDPNFKYDTLIRLIDLEFLTIGDDGSYHFTLNILRDWWIKKSKIRLS